MPDNTYPLPETVPAEPDTNWDAIAEDAVRREYEVPWLAYEMAQATEKGLHDDAPGRDYWLGYRDALRMAMETPHRRVQEAAAAVAEAEAENRRKEEANARRVPAGSGFLRRLNPAYWRGE